MLFPFFLYDVSPFAFTTHFIISFISSPFFTSLVLLPSFLWLFLYILWHHFCPPVLAINKGCYIHVSSVYHVFPSAISIHVLILFLSWPQVGVISMFLFITSFLKSFHFVIPCLSSILGLKLVALQRCLKMLHTGLMLSLSLPASPEAGPELDQKTNTPWERWVRSRWDRKSWSRERVKTGLLFIVSVVGSLPVFMLVDGFCVVFHSLYCVNRILIVSFFLSQRRALRASPFCW